MTLYSRNKDDDSYSHRLGYLFALTYNSKSKCLWPSDLKFMLLTLTIIIGPAALGYLVIWTSDPKVVPKEDKIILSCVHAFFLAMCLISLFRVTFSDPGVLPSLYMNSGIESTEIKVANSTKEYYVEY